MIHIAFHKNEATVVFLVVFELTKLRTKTAFSLTYIIPLLLSCFRLNRLRHNTIPIHVWG